MQTHVLFPTHCKWSSNDLNISKLPCQILSLACHNVCASLLINMYVLARAVLMYAEYIFTPHRYALISFPLVPFHPYRSLPFIFCVPYMSRVLRPVFHSVVNSACWTRTNKLTRRSLPSDGSLIRRVISLFPGVPIRLLSCACKNCDDGGKGVKVY